MKLIKVLLIVVVLLAGVTGCNKVEKEDSYGYLEHLCKQSQQAKVYAKENLERMFENEEMIEAKISRCVYSYLYEEVLTYVVAFEYTNGPELKKYGYKIGVDKSREYFVIEEGATIASFLLNDE
ncbi:hypothetical protein [Tannockella kyphosi]|uniref:hypothetical protein n=1 Tax=Tannockella kyphosi TaxID=2899121 RepID=UPI002012F7A5|nr:hypothetical protein [Tannockella kyphosi]